MYLKVKLEVLAWDVDDEELGLESLSEDASLEEIIEHDYKVKQDLIKEKMNLPEEVEVEVWADDDDDFEINKDGKRSIYSGLLCSMCSYEIQSEYGYGPIAIGDIEILNEPDIVIEEE